MTIVWGDKKTNLLEVENAIERVHPDTDLLLLPEMFSTGFPSHKDKDYVRHLAERNSGETVEFLKELARRYNFAIAGSFMADTGGLLFNRAFFIEPSGDEYYADKRHLFTMAGEDKIFTHGRNRLGVRYRGWNIAMVVCYDIRFPAWCRNSNNEYDLLLVSANWPSSRIDAWNKLLPARAIENLAYVAAVDCRGTDDNSVYYDGSSHIYDFKGKDISVKDNFNDFVYASLSHNGLDAFREKFPALRDTDIFSIEP
ncbi:MAG: nitrilase family protein [Muribaculaceae bacterium]|nr:nitrilase family protein [Muribaculaceae bacterium]